MPVRLSVEALHCRLSDVDVTLEADTLDGTPGAVSSMRKSTDTAMLVPVAFVAVTDAVYEPAVDADPEINPVVVFRLNPADKPVAA